MSSSNCCFLTCIQVSQKTGQMVWYSHLFKNFPQFIVIHTAKGFGIVNKAKIYVFLELSCFSIIQQMLAIWSLVPLPFLKQAWTKKDVLFIIGDWNAKLGSQETPGVTGKFGLGVRNEAGQRLKEFFQENALVIANTLFNNTREDSTHGHHQMVNTEIRLITIFAAKDGEALYSQQKQDWELTVAQIMSFWVHAKFRLKLKKVGKTTRQFRYDENQIP